MMKYKSNKVQIILVIVVLLIWTKVAFDFFGFKNSNNNPEGVVATPVADTDSQKEFYTDVLSLNYADPFRMKSSAKIVSSSVSKPVSDPNTLHSLSDQQIDQIRYSGFARTDRDLIAVISMARRMHRFHENDTILNFTIQQITRDSLILKDANQKNYVVHRKD